jgi:hypothetical protein
MCEEMFEINTFSPSMDFVKNFDHFKILILYLWRTLNSTWFSRFHLICFSFNDAILYQVWFNDVFGAGILIDLLFDF